MADLGAIGTGGSNSLGGVSTPAGGYSFSAPTATVITTYEVLSNLGVVAPNTDLIDQSKLLLCWPNRADQSTLSMGSWSVSLPLNNLKNRVIKKKARTVDAANASTKFKVSIDKGRPMLVAALAGHNASAHAQWRVRFYADYDMTILKWDSTQIDVWPVSFEYEQLEWEDDNFWLGNDELDNALDYTPFAVVFADQIYQDVRAVLIEIFDADNSDGYFEAGRLFVGTGWQPEFNAEYGMQFNHEIDTKVEESLDGTEYFDRKRAKRVASFQLDNMQAADAFNKLFSMQRDQGVDKEVIFAYDPDRTGEFFYNRTFLGRMKQADPIATPYYERWQAPITIKEII